MKLLIVSGLSGSGKSIALNTLEDCGYYCIDNLPSVLLTRFVNKVMRKEPQLYTKTAIGIDARNKSGELSHFEEKLNAIRALNIECEIVYMQADEDVLIKRYSQTRRKHPLSSDTLSLTEAISKEKQLLQSVANCADIQIDTSRTHEHQLRKLIKDEINERDERYLSLQFLSFGFKYGVPLDADFVFDVRCLPNPYWVPHLRALTGQDTEVVDFFQKEDTVKDLFQDIAFFVQRWTPHFKENNRSYLTIAVGCTGGQHRSVYLINTLANHFKDKQFNLIVRHRELH